MIKSFILNCIKILNANNLLILLGINYNFQKYFCTENNYVSFIISNSHEDSINFEIFSGDNLLKSEVCEYKNSKEISLLINTELKLADFYLNWKFLKNKIKGKIDLSQIFKEFEFKLKNDVINNFFCLMKIL